MLKKLSIHTIVLSGLMLLAIGKFSFSFSSDLLYSFLVLLFTAIVYHVIANRKQIIGNHSAVFTFELKNTLIYSTILFLLVFPIGTVSGLISLSILSLFGLIARRFMRYQDKPIFNPAVLALLWLAVLSQFVPIAFVPDIFTAWHGVNYQVSVFGNTLPAATVISFLLAFILTCRMNKYGYALGFFLSLLIGGYFVMDPESIKALLLDGTIYFFFWVMASEPKTSPSGQYQWFFWALLGIILLLVLKYHIPGDYISALATINLLYFGHRYLMNTKSVTSSVVYKKWQKYICTPCGYIYDPEIGDEDSWISPGTEFSDIPDSWRCPVCGVTKSDFIPYDTEASTTSAIIIEKKYLNPTTIELTIETPKVLEVKPGQFGKIILTDAEGTFERSYSVVRQSDRKLVFGIKLSGWRGARVLAESREGNNVGFSGIFGTFTLQDTSRPKVFIATGTGLSPLIKMLDHTPKDISKTVYFSVSTQDELFYEDILASYENTDLHISISRETVPGYRSGRIQLDKEFSLDTEFYLCGNPGMIREKTEELEHKGYVHVYNEAFV